MGHAGIVYSTYPDPHSAQFRAYWVDSFGPGLYTEAEIDQLVAQTRAANMNAIIAQVTRRADCLCNRSIMPRTEAGIDPYPFDPLQTLIDKAHAVGIEVHAWVNSTIMWASETPPRDAAHIFHVHGPSAGGSESWVSLRHDGANRGGNLYFFDLGHPGAAEYIVNMFLSIVRNYDVDGINFDYIRYPDYNPGVNIPAWGYNSVAVARFQAATGRTDVPAPTDTAWMAWRREQVTNVVRRVYVEAFAMKRQVRVSADTITYGSFADGGGDWTQTRPYLEVLQDWRAWMEERILDLNVPMNYKREQAVTEPNNQRRMFEEWNTFIKDHQYRRHAAIGTALYLNTVDDSVAQIRKALGSSLAGNQAQGWVGFSYRTPDSLVNDRRRRPEEAREELMLALARPNLSERWMSESAFAHLPVFADPVPIPTMPWKAQPVSGYIRGQVKTPEGAVADQVRVDVYEVATNTLVASRLTDGSGWFGFVDLPPGEYRVTVEGSPQMGTAAAGINVASAAVTPIWLNLSR